MNLQTQYGLAGLVIGFLLGLLIAPLFTGSIGMWGMMGNGKMMMSSQNIDQHFIEQMIPHHEGAIAMAQLALERSQRPEIVSLASGIIEAQTFEITSMQNWYTQWYGEIPSDKNSGHMMHMDGMEGDLEGLQNAWNFDQEFLRQMIVHHEMAVMMAEMLLSGTERPEMKELADQIITSQTREIDMMRSWGDSWFQERGQEPVTSNDEVMPGSAIHNIRQ